MLELWSSPLHFYAIYWLKLLYVHHKYHTNETLKLLLQKSWAKTYFIYILERMGDPSRNGSNPCCQHIATSPGWCESKSSAQLLTPVMFITYTSICSSPRRFYFSNIFCTFIIFLKLTKFSHNVMKIRCRDLLSESDCFVKTWFLGC